MPCSLPCFALLRPPASLIREAALRAASTKGGGRLRRPTPFVDSFMDGCVGAGEAADAAETHVNVRKTCTCMHTQRATSDPQGLHGWPIHHTIRIWSEYGPNMVRICPNMSEYGPNMSEYVRIWFEYVRIWFEYGSNMSEYVRICPNMFEYVRIWYEYVGIWSEYGPNYQKCRKRQ